jgi:hypothetical protein
MGTVKRYVSLDEANALIPHVGSVLQRIMQLHGLLRVTAEHLAGFGVRLNAPLIAGSELFGVPEIDRMVVRARAIFYTIRDDIALLEDVGAEVRDVEEGLVDFRSLLDGRDEVHLCWRLGDREITSFHEKSQGFASRQPIEGRAFLDTPERLSRESVVE